MKHLCIFLMLLCCATLSFAQDMRARTVTGETVMLRKNGTWFALDPSSAHGDTAVTFDGRVVVLLPDRTWSMTALKRSTASLPRPSAPSSASTPKSADGGSESFVSMVGQRVPAFLFRDADNALVDINQYSGKVVLINFWATWCRPCITEMPYLEREVWRRFRSKDFRMVAVTDDDPGEANMEFLRSSGISYPIYYEPASTIHRLFHVTAIPQNIVVGKDGIIIHHSEGFGGVQFQEMVQTIAAAIER